MYKSLALFAFFIVGNLSLLAQDVNPSANKTNIQKPSRDFLMIQLTYDGWANAPDSIKLNGFHRGFNAYLCYDFPLGKSNFSFAAGVGVGTSNMYFKDQQISLTDTGSLGEQIRFIAESPDKNYTKYKLTTAYLEAPFELRYFGNKDNRNKGFKAAIGLRAGTLLASHTKGVYKLSGNGPKITDKEITKRYVEPWRIGATLRVGYGNITAFGAYNLNSLFRDNQGPAVQPFSIGIALTGL